MQFKPDKCPVCNGDWIAIEESMLTFSLLKRDEDDEEEYDWGDEQPAEAHWGSNEPVVIDGRVSVRCDNGCDHDGNVWCRAEMDPEDGSPEPVPKDGVLINITWTEQHNATFLVKKKPEQVTAEDIPKLMHSIPIGDGRTFQQVTEVHEWGMVDE